ncbi:aminotransferase class I/II-fold pyridoxal phosphate-dependent enzyme [Nocardioides sp. MAH-18]|uniref:Aminotransferase class I/II-fold pyridoxal phosphate-dependent enzyme n=1 Tax=Nocardioides agri TaxID=2682843 RepID=A0A6L6XW85_9ACTN|nr:GntG family PLP-dependent aldolase [Nocardioides sp. CGMCC 1.13656]MBA2952287.1 aminotransferase class I/II-fold pyridoxal phosphate-dependent enzyme [Nocardioides sp. CGMCC 1.13656]MVQ51449.1 aminotransferase class I/II-fold pyridoxal phosphate-dependent enzyme [Nocardioides sp. MAH-18]
MIDLRSDTLTTPTDKMRAAMARAEVGDDVYGEDPTVARLEERVAGLFGHEAALFTPTGSMANVLAVRSLVQAGQEVLCEASAHIARAELGAHGAYTGLTMRTWIHRRGQVDLPTIQTLFAPDMGPFFVPTAAISVENTHNFAGGAVLPLQDLRDLREFATGAGARVHMDGARIWNAHVATGTPLAEYGAVADVLAVCLSKGLGAPVGSLMVGSRDAIAEARIWRKRMGGGMRQVGILAAAGLHALDHHVERLADDHAHARLLAEACGVDPATVDTNIVVVQRSDAADFVAAARAEGVLVATVGPTAVRLVTHLDVSDADAERAAAVLARVAG